MVDTGYRSFQLILGGNCTNFNVSSIETTFLALILAYILALNVFVIVVTIGSAELRGCLFSMQLAASYLGNIFGGSSLIGNDIYYSGNGVPPVCQTGKDFFFFLYFGNSLNMVILVLNTRYRYHGITSIKRKQNMGATSPRNPRGGGTTHVALKTKDVVWKVWVPALCLSICICVIATLLQRYVVHYQFLVSMGICVLPIGFSILWNILLTVHFKTGLTNSKYLQRSQSIRVLKRATFIIHSTVLAHALFLLVCTTAILCSIFYKENEAVVKGISWLLRVFYLLLFTIEGHVYLYKVDVARKIIKKKLMDCLGCVGEDVDDILRTGYVNQNFRQGETKTGTFSVS